MRYNILEITISSSILHKLDDAERHDFFLMFLDNSQFLPVFLYFLFSFSFLLGGTEGLVGK